MAALIGDLDDLPSNHCSCGVGRWVGGWPIVVVVVVGGGGGGGGEGGWGSCGKPRAVPQRD